jgi:hypothetical protein
MKSKETSAVGAIMTRVAATALLLAGKVVQGVAGAESADPHKAAGAGLAWARIQSFFRPPGPLADDYGSYRSLLEFDDGRVVRDAAAWPERRREILAYWQKVMGPWPALLEKPKLQVMRSERRESFAQHRVRVDIAPEQTVEGWLLVPEGRGPFPAVLVPFYEPETSIGLKGTMCDFAHQLGMRGFVTLSIGSPGGDARRPETGQAPCQPLSFLAYVAANCHTALAQRPDVDGRRIGIVGHSYGGKWAMFAACLYDEFACAAWSDPGIVWDESRPNVNYWDVWYLGRDPDRSRKPGTVTPDNPRTGAYKVLYESGHDLHELHALMAPRPFLVSGGSEDPPQRWRALAHSIAVNRLLGHENRVAMANRPTHEPTSESNEAIYAFFEHFLVERGTPSGARAGSSGP